MQNQNIQQE